MNLIKKLFGKKQREGVFVGRQKARDISYLAQSPATFVGRRTRSIHDRVTPDVIDSTIVPLYFGCAVIDTANNTVRGVQATDAGAKIAGFLEQPFPYQAAYSSGPYGAQDFTAYTSPSANNLCSIVRSGHIGVYCNGATAATKATVPYLWLAPSTGSHIQGMLEIAASSTVASAATAGNTGNGTLGALTVTPASALPGGYQVIFTGPTTFNVIDPNGRELAPGTTGKAYTGGGVSFTITPGATAFASGDSFTVTNTAQTLALTNAYFPGPGDSTGAIELAFNL